MNTHQEATPIQTVTRATFDALVLRGEGPIAVEFMSYGCAHCRAIEPYLARAAAMVEKREKLFRVNVGVETTLASEYAIAGTPTFVMFQNAHEVGRVEGAEPSLDGVIDAITSSFAS